MYAIDTETHLVTQDTPAPKVVCTSTHHAGGSNIYSGVGQGTLMPVSDIVVGHNLAFDMYGIGRKNWGPVLSLYRSGRVWDTMLWEQLRAIERGTLDQLSHTKGHFSLAACAARRTEYLLRKDESTWRLRYAELDGIPLDMWPSDALLYAVEDAKATHALGEAQLAEHTYSDMVLQCRAALALHAISAEGLVVDRARAIAFSADTSRMYDSTKETAPFHRKVGKRVQKSVKDLREHILAHLGDSAPTTPGGQISTDADTLAMCDTPECRDLLKLAHLEKLISTYIPVLANDRVHPRYRSLVSSGRTSSYSPNIQNLPRAEGVRECFTAREGYVLCSIDYDAAEMRALGQLCLAMGFGGGLAYALNAGEDPHILMAANMLRSPYDDIAARIKAGDKVAKTARQFAKIANFGFSGGMGHGTFVQYAKGYGITIGETEAYDLRRHWLETWPCMRIYLQEVGKEVDMHGCLTQYRSGRVRGGLNYTAGCNTLFQGLVADGAKDALWALWTSTVGGGSLEGSHVVAFLHDEYLLEVPESDAHESALLARDIVVDRMQKWMPDVKVTASPALMRHWSKSAEPAYVGARLIPWEDRS